jgi:phage terminase Nu1 subunit (DNA packaging protein)
MTPINKDTARQLLTRSRAAIARFERAKAGGNATELAEARNALEHCHAEVRRFVTRDLDSRIRSFQAR